MTDIVEIIFKGRDEFSNVAGGIGGAFTKLGGIVAAGAAAGVAGMVALGASSVKAAMDMETQMSNIASILNTTVDQIQPLDDLIQELGLNPNLKVDAVQAASAIEMLARNGLSMTEIMEGAAESTVLLANATGAEFGNAANIATDAMAVFGIKASEMTTAVDGIVSVTTNSKFTIDDFALALAQGGGVASAAGVSFEDFNTTIAAISPLFASGSDAGTSLKTMLLRLVPSTNAAEDAMYELGLVGYDTGAAMSFLQSNGIEPLSDKAGDLIPQLRETAEAMGQTFGEEGDFINWLDNMGFMQNQFYDAEGNMKNMAEVAGVLQDAFAGLSEEQKTSYMQTIFGTDAMRAAVALANTGDEAFAGLAEAMGQTDAAANAATRMDNVAGVLEILRGVVDAAVLSLGKGLLPIMRLFADRALELANFILPILEEGLGEVSAFVEGLSANLEGGMNLWDAAIDSLLTWTQVGEDNAFAILGIADAVDGFMVKLQEFLTPIQTAVAGFFEWKDVLIALALVLGGVVLSAIISVVTAIAPIILALGAIVAAVAIVRQVWENDWLGIRTALENVWLILQPVLQTLWNWLQVNIPAALEVLRGFWDDTLMPALQRAWEFLSLYVIPVFQAIAEVWIVALQLALTAVSGIWQNVLLPAMTAVWSFIKDKLGPVFEWLKSKVIDPVVSSFGGLEGAISRVLGWLDNLKSKLSSITLPDWMTPGSPTPWELGLRGVRDELQALYRGDLPALSAGIQGLQNISNRTQNVNQVTNIYTSRVDTRGESAASMRFALGGI